MVQKKKNYLDIRLRRNVYKVWNESQHDFLGLLKQEQNLKHV